MSSRVFGAERGCRHARHRTWRIKHVSINYIVDDFWESSRSSDLRVAQVSAPSLYTHVTLHVDQTGILRHNQLNRARRNGTNEIFPSNSPSAAEWPVNTPNSPRRLSHVRP